MVRRMSEEGDSGVADLAALTADLERSFQPAWTREIEAALSGDGARWQAEADVEGDKPQDTKPSSGRKRERRGFEGRRGELRKDKYGRREPSGQRRVWGDDGAERPAAHENRDRTDRKDFQGSPRTEGTQSGILHTQDRRRERFQKSGKGGYGPGAGFREGRGERHEPLLRGWNIHLYPENAGVEGIAREIKHTLKAFPLFGLARLVLEKPARWRVKLRNVKGPTLWRAVEDGTLWLSREQALDHACKAMLPKYFRVEKTAAEPPKGNFTCVAQCGLSGELISPPNYHDYQLRLRELHAERFPHMKFEDYLKNVRMLRGEEVLAQWKERESVREEYVFVPQVTHRKPEAAGIEPSPEGGAVGTGSFSETAEAVGQRGNIPASAEDGEDIPASANAEGSVEERAGTVQAGAEVAPEARAASEDNTTNSPGAAASLSPEPRATGDDTDYAAGADKGEVADGMSAADEAESGEGQPTSTTGGKGAEASGTAENQPLLAEPEPEVRFARQAEALRFLREKTGDHAVREVSRSATLSGEAALASAQPVAALVRLVWERMQRAPMPFASELARGLHMKGCQFFKDKNGVTFVNAARPRKLDAETMPVSEAILKILETVAGMEDKPRIEQFAALQATRPASGEDEESLRARDTALQGDLRWLLREGYLIDFAGRGYAIPRVPSPRKTLPEAQGNEAGPGSAAPSGPGEIDPMGAETNTKVVPEPAELAEAAECAPEDGSLSLPEASRESSLCDCIRTDEEGMVAGQTKMEESPATGTESGGSQPVVEQARSIEDAHKSGDEPDFALEAPIEQEATRDECAQPAQGTLEKHEIEEAHKSSGEESGLLPKTNET